MPTITTKIESARGCGYRKPGGIYLITDPGTMRDCGRFPVRLDICPCCGAGIKFSRGWTWIDADEIIMKQKCRNDSDECHSGIPCPFADGAKIGRAGLLWIGKRYYKSPHDWMSESAERGVSRRVRTIPHGFELGKTWIFVAHLAGDSEPCASCRGTGDANYDPAVAPGMIHRPEFKKCPDCDGTGTIPKSAIIQAFRPNRMEYVVSGDESPDELELLEKRGFSLVRVVRDVDAQTKIPETAETTSPADSDGMDEIAAKSGPEPGETAESGGDIPEPAPSAGEPGKPAENGDNDISADGGTVICPDCGGDGFREYPNDPADPNSIMGISDQGPCPRCDGTGEISGKSTWSPDMDDYI